MCSDALEACETNVGIDGDVKFETSSIYGGIWVAGSHKRKRDLIWGPPRGLPCVLRFRFQKGLDSGFETPAMYLRGHSAWESCRFWKTVCCGLPRKMPCASNRCQALVQRCLGQRLCQALETTLFGPRKPCGALSMLDDAKRLALGSLCTRRRAGVPSHRQCTFSGPWSSTRRRTDRVPARCLQPRN